MDISSVTSAETQVFPFGTDLKDTAELSRMDLNFGFNFLLSQLRKSLPMEEGRKKEKSVF